MLEEEASEMSWPISTQEIFDTIKNNESPGTDGLPGELSKQVREEITPML